MQYKDFVKMHMAGKKFGSPAEVRAHMKQIAILWKEEKQKMMEPKKGKGAMKTKRGKGAIKQQSLIGDVAGELLSGASNLARKYL